MLPLAPVTTSGNAVAMPPSNAIHFSPILAEMARLEKGEVSLAAALRRIRRDPSAVSFRVQSSQKTSREGLVLQDINAKVKCEALCANCDLPRSDIDRWDERTCCRIQP